MEKVRQLRDPAIFRDGDEAYLLYAVAGEQGIGVALVGGGVAGIQPMFNAT